MQNKNFILFAVLAALIVGGWFYLQSTLPPPPPAKKGADLTKGDKKDDKQPEPPLKKPDEPKDKKEDKQPAPPAPGHPVAASPDITIGGGEDSDFHLEAVLTSYGAG